MLRFSNLRSGVSRLVPHCTRASSNFSNFINNTDRLTQQSENPTNPGPDDVPSFRDLRSANPSSFANPRTAPPTSTRSMDFVRKIIQENKDFEGFHNTRTIDQNPDIVHMKFLNNNTLINLTDSKGNTKVWAAAGVLPDQASKVSKYASEATAEHVGRLARTMGVKSVVIRVKGFQFFKKKRLAITAFRDGYTHSRGDLNPIVYIEDVTRLAHNGCRLPKKAKK
uniref:Ribosomal protein S11 n=1 Tax=Kalanchoe fedtschenkoi TaxID=63787 RepID=A0A7N0U9D3_KALFE